MPFEQQFTQAQTGTGFSGGAISNLGETIRKAAMVGVESQLKKKETEMIEQGSRDALFSQQKGLDPELKEVGVFGRLDRAYNAGVEKTYLASIYNDIESEALLALNDPKLKSDPMALSDALSAARQGMVENVLPQVSTQVNEQWQATIDKAVQKSRLSAQQKQIEESNAEFDTTSEIALNKATENFIDGDFQSGLKDLQVFNDTQDALVENGAISERVAEQRKQNARDSVIQSGHLGTIKEVLTDNPTMETVNAAYSEVVNIDKSDIQDMDALQKQAMVDSLYARVNAAAATLNGKKTNIKNMVSDAVAVHKKGQDFKGYQDLEEKVIELGLDDQLGILKESKRQKDVTRSFMQKSLNQQEATVEQLKQTAKSKNDLDLYERLSAAAAETKKALEDRPMEFATEIGLIEPLSPLDLSEDGIDVFLKKRQEQAEIIKGNYKLGGVSPLTSTETDFLVNTMTQGTASQSLGVLEAINDNLSPSESNAVYSQMSKKGASQFAVAGTMAQQTRYTVAENILKGRQLRIEDSNILPGKADVDMAVNSSFDVVYSNNVTMRNAMSESVKSVYATLAQQDGDFSGVMNQDRWDDAVNMVTGGIITYDAVGLSFNSSADNSVIEAPYPNATASDFKDMLMDLTPDRVREMGGVMGFNDDESLKRFVDNLPESKFESRGSGRYTVEVGGLSFLNSEGQPFILDLR